MHEQKKDGWQYVMFFFYFAYSSAYCTATATHFLLTRFVV